MKKNTKNTKNTKSTKNTKNTKKIKPIEVSSMSVIRATPYEDMYFFDMILNGISIYGCKLIEGKNGWFISFPSKKSAKKDGKWYNHCWAPLSEDDTAEIIAAVLEACDEDEDEDEDEDALPF